MKHAFRIVALVCCFNLSMLIVSCGPTLPHHPEQLQFSELSFNLPQVDPLVMDNGIRLFLKEDNELPLVQMTAMIGAGAINTPKEKAGFEGLFGSTWRTGGAGERSPEELDEYLDQLAANLSASMGPYSSQLDISLRSEDLDKGISIIADMLRRPRFAAEKLEIARLKAQEGVRRQNDNPGSISRRLLMAALYPDHYLGYSPTYESLAAITREDLAEFHEKFFAPNVLWVAVSGDFDRDNLMQLLDSSLGDWSRQNVPNQKIEDVPRPERSSVQVAVKDIPQTTIVVGDVGLTKDNPDQYAVKVMNYILGGGGFNSRLMREIRSNRGLAYSAYSYFQVGRRLPGPFVAATETKSDSVVPALTLLRNIMADMRNKKVTEGELALAKESLINSFVFGFENSHSVVKRQMDQVFFDYPEDYLVRYRDRIAAVALDDVQRVAKKYIGLERQQIVLVGDLNSFHSELKQAGFDYNEVILDETP